MASRQALVEEGEEGQQALLGPQPMTLRFVPTRPTYLLNLVSSIFVEDALQAE